MNAWRVALVLPIALSGWGCTGPRRPAEDALRRTAVARVFEACKGSVVKFTATRTETTETRPPDGKGPVKRVHTTHTQWGSGCILHPAGYVLTNSHMLRFEGRRVAKLADGKTCPVRVVAEDPANDLALMKMDAGRPLAPLKLGQSRTVMVGEPAITIGNPFGIDFTVAAGIVSGVGRGTNTEYANLTDMIQTDASINPGTSGGPLLNILGEMIGLCTSNKKEAENIGFAISIDKIRAVFGDLVAAEQRYGYVLGLTVANDGAPRVTEVAKGSPAEAAGIQVGDLVAAIGGQPVHSAVDYHLALIERKGGESLPLALLREGKRIEATAALEEVKRRPAEKATGLVPGVSYQHFHGSWKTLPDFDKLKPTASGVLPTFSLGAYEGKANFAMRYTGSVEAPKDGVYLFSTRSDDGSRLYIGDQLVVDNDGSHAAGEKRGFIALQAGKHPIRVTFFQGPGDVELKVFYEGPGITRREVPATALSSPKP
ncbi:MAG TPA: trypsin-like peptidase domain-containing protein [Planctomycetota bacterium]|nr:trypsin-like peptidase domain-containing protein [Planctomycetota bacterium]